MSAYSMLGGGGVPGPQDALRGGIGRFVDTFGQ